MATVAKATKMTSSVSMDFLVYQQSAGDFSGRAGRARDTTMPTLVREVLNPS